MNTTKRLTAILFTLLLISSGALSKTIYQPIPEGTLKNTTYRSIGEEQKENIDVVKADVVHFPGDSVTQGSVIIDGKTIEYTARAGTLPLADTEGNTLARVFYISYTKNRVTDVSKRPLLFSFNGGPGSASIWMHIGLLGPRRVQLGDGGGVKRDHSLAQPVPPAKMISNEYSMLDVADLVFIDPVSTGYSRALPGVDASQFHGFAEDIAAVSEFIRMYILRNNRWNSPKFIIGESYGTRRAAGLSATLKRRMGIDLNGLILVSAGSIGEQFGDFGILKYALNIPHAAATAWYHHKLPSDLQSKSLREFLDEVEAFAVGDFALALLRGNNLSPQKRDEMVTKVARYTGLTEAYVKSVHFRIDLGRFRKELLRDQGLTVGRLDTRFTGSDYDSGGESTGYDASSAAIGGSFAQTFNAFVRDELGYRSDLQYAVSGSVRPWNGPGSMNLLQTLRSSMAQNPHLHVMIADGYYDKLYFWPEFTFSQFDFSGLRDRVVIETYEAGHMMYIEEQSLAKMKGDMARFVERALGR
ncbi:S10 family peptidase [Acidobacteriota bacterium]